MKELTQLQLLTLAKQALQNKCDTIVSMYGKPERTREEVICKASETLEYIAWVNAEIERLGKEKQADRKP